MDRKQLSPTRILEIVARALRAMASMSTGAPAPALRPTRIGRQ